MKRCVAGMAFTLLVAACCDSTSAAESKRVAADRPIAAMTVVASTSGTAVVRFGQGPLTKIRVGDRVGQSAATVKEISSTSVVLDDVESAGGRETRALVIVKVGETGGTRLRREPPENMPSMVRSVTVSPSSSKSAVKR